MQNVFKLILAIVICEAAGVIGAVVTGPAVATWYVGLAKPPLNPPAWVFGPVWLTLYALMGIAAFLVWQKWNATEGMVQRDGTTTGTDARSTTDPARRGARIALGVFVLQLVLNTLWSIIFFGWHNIGGALWELLLLEAIIMLTVYLFSRVSKAAAWLLLPYVLWVAFALYLNATIFLLN